VAGAVETSGSKAVGIGFVERIPQSSTSDHLSLTTVVVAPGRRTSWARAQGHAPLPRPSGGRSHKKGEQTGDRFRNA
jgi:hypothetical protein